MNSPEPENLHDRVRAAALSLGFDDCGIARTDDHPEDLEQLNSWLAAGRHGTMDWMARDPQRRASPSLVIPSCRSIIVVTLNYLTHVPVKSDGTGTPEPGDEGTSAFCLLPSAFGKVSRYARGRDYHRVFEKKLRKMARFIDEAAPGARSRGFVDYGPVMERPWAARAGLGFVGKHTLLIHPARGSWFFLGVVLTSAEIEPSLPLQIPGDCGDCRRCIDICPTGAITEPFHVDARKCLSYLTIEHEGDIPEATWTQFDGWIFGCDACQDVCPYNRKRALPATVDAFAPRNVPGEWPLADVLRLTDEELEARFPGSPLRRAGAEHLVRNALIVASQRGGAGELELVCQIALDDTRPGWLRNMADRAAHRIRERLHTSGQEPGHENGTEDKR